MINTLKTVKEFKDLCLETMEFHKTAVSLGKLDKQDSFDSIDCIYAISSYIDLLEQPLKLGMFVPCDEDDKPLEKPTMSYNNDQYYGCEMDEYQQAEECVLFAGFEYNEECPKLSIYDKENDLYFSFGKDSYTISDLVHDSFFTKGNRKYKLTDNFKKLITG